MMNKEFLMGVVFAVFAMIVFVGCEQEYTPKPRGYFRIDLPEKGYQIYRSTECPFQFEYPTYAELRQDTMFLGERVENPCWMNIDFKGLSASIHMSYKAVDGENTLQKLIEDSHKLTFKHTIKAEYIDESVIRTANGVQGVLYEVGGNAASNVQYYVTDSADHFIRGSLYFSATPNEDSLAPVISFVKEDMVHFFETLQWAE